MTSNQIEGAEVEVDLPSDDNKRGYDWQQDQRLPLCVQENLTVSEPPSTGRASCRALE